MKIILNDHAGSPGFSEALKELADGAHTLSVAVSYMQVSGWEIFHRHTRGLNLPAMRIVCTDQLGVTQPAAVERAIRSGLLYTEMPEGRNRYPRWEWILETSLELCRASLHVCGRGARAKLMEGKLLVSGFQRIQVNGGILALEVEHLCEMYPRHTIITQHHTYNAHLLAVRSLNHAILIDASGGRGISPDGWGQPETDKAVGFAGGLGPDNLAGELQTISRIARPGWWVDMEGKLRVDDWFSLELAGQCCAQFSSVNDQAVSTASKRL